MNLRNHHLVRVAGQPELEPETARGEELVVHSLLRELAAKVRLVHAVNLGMREVGKIGLLLKLLEAELRLSDSASLLQTRKDARSTRAQIDVRKVELAACLRLRLLDLAGVYRARDHRALLNRRR